MSSWLIVGLIVAVVLLLIVIFAPGDDEGKVHCHYCGKPCCPQAIIIGETSEGPSYMSFNMCGICKEKIDEFAAEELPKLKYRYIYECSMCKGSGKVKGYICLNCKGRGRNQAIDHGKIRNAIIEKFGNYYIPRYSTALDKFLT